jgi:hypothetical protein
MLVFNEEVTYLAFNAILGDLSNNMSSYSLRTGRPDIMVPRGSRWGNSYSIPSKNSFGETVYHINPNSRKVTDKNIEDAYKANFGKWRASNQIWNKAGTQFTINGGKTWYTPPKK